MLKIEPRKLTECVETYISTAAWAATDDDGNSIADIWYANDHKLAPSELIKIQDFIIEFLNHERILPISLTCPDLNLIMYDLYLARNGHPAYFDQLPESTRSTLIEVARSFGRSKSYVGDDGLIYFD